VFVVVLKLGKRLWWSMLTTLMGAERASSGLKSDVADNGDRRGLVAVSETALTMEVEVV
jgi:hypothetical protein